MKRIGCIAGILISMFCLSAAQGQELPVPWANTPPQSSRTPTPQNTPRTPAQDLQQSYFSNQNGVYDPRYYDARNGWFNPPSPNAMLPNPSQLAYQPQLPQSFSNGNAGLVNPLVQDKVSMVVNVWNAFTGDNWWKGIGKVLSLAVAVRMGGVSSLMNPNVAYDQKYLQRSPTQPWANTGGRVVAPKNFHNCEGCDQYAPVNPNGQVGDVFRYGVAPTQGRPYGL